MSLTDLISFVAILGFLWVCEWSGPGSKRKLYSLIMAGIGMYLLGSYNGYQAGRKREIRQARQTEILSGRAYPR